MLNRALLAAPLVLLPQSSVPANDPVLTEPTAEAFHQVVEWSPDGGQLAFSEFAGGEFSPDAFVISVISAREGSESEGPARRDVARGVFLSWSPDGKRIVHDALRDGNWDLYVVELESGEERRLTRGESEDTQPAWSPRGDRIVFCSDREGNKDLYVVGLGGGEPRRLTTDEAQDFNPAWSPAGDSVVFFRERGDGKDQIWTVGVDDGVERRVTDGEHHNFYPSFLPDGRVSFTRVLEDGTKSLAVANADGSDLERVGEVPLSFARWSPKGDRVAFISGRWPRTAIYTMDADGAKPRKLVN